MLAIEEATSKASTEQLSEQSKKAQKLALQMAKLKADLKHQQENQDAFKLDGQTEPPEFHLEGLVADQSPALPADQQSELFLPEINPEQAPDDQQLELDGLAKPIYAMAIEGIAKPLEFHYANNLLESLEAQDVQVPYQCREGYCGGCRTDLLEGEVAYLQEPMAWINEGEILPCCCVPKTALKLKLKG